jgi:hypothetical protein
MSCSLTVRVSIIPYARDHKKDYSHFITEFEGTVYNLGMDKLTVPAPTKSPRQLQRESQVLQVFALLQSGECDTVEAACARANIEIRMFERWAKRSTALAIAQETILEQAKAVKSAVIEAYPKAVASLIQRLLDSDVGNMSFIELWKEFKALHSDVTDQEGESTDEAESYLQGGRAWLSGPKTITVTFDDGTSVKVEKAGPTILSSSRKGLSMANLVPTKETPTTPSVTIQKKAALSICD